MAATDATPLPIKAAAYRVTVPILDADGDLVTAAATLDSEVSKDGGTFADCTNEATEIATSSGMYFLDLTATEMTADTVAVIVKTGTAGAKTTPIVMYPQEDGDVNVDVTTWLGVAPLALSSQKVQTHAVTTATGAIVAASFAAGAIDAAAIATDAIGAAELAADAVRELRSLASGTTDSGTTTTVVDTERTEADTDYWLGQLIVFTSGTLNGQARVITGFNAATDTLTFAPALTVAAAVGHTYEIWPSGDYLRPTVTNRTLDVSTTGEAGLDWANIGAPTTTQTLSGTTVNDLTTKTGFSLSAAGLAAIWDVAMTEISAIPAVTASFRDAFRWLFALSRNKITQTATTSTLRNDADAGNIATSTVSDDGTTFTRGEWI